MQASFGFAAGEAPRQVVFRLADSDGIDRWVYDLGRLRLWRDWWFVGLRSGAEYALRRDPEAGWQIRLEKWQDSTPEPVSDLMFPGPGAWHAATKLPADPEQRKLHLDQCEWHAVDERHRGELENAGAGSPAATEG